MGKNKEDTKKNENENELEDYQRNEIEIADYELEIVKWNKYIKPNKKKEIKKTRV
ncbi:MAG: hypothetical protein IH964_12505 [Candidatus Dadabacteria bacterium]|nr:hypothetical protein [Candidatus Dadabacteria bacterium]